LVEGRIGLWSGGEGRRMREEDRESEELREEWVAVGERADGRKKRCEAWGSGWF
jgi:hypothetical protein